MEDDGTDGTNRTDMTPDEHPKAFEPFRPSYTMDDVLKREEEIREASLACYHEKARQSRDRLRRVKHANLNKENQDCEWQRINSGCLELDGRWE